MMHLEFWSPQYRRNVEALETVQRRLTRGWWGLEHNAGVVVEADSIVVFKKL